MVAYINVEGITSAQLPKALEEFSKIIKDFDLILEIGTWSGGFSWWLNTNKREDAKFKTYEIDPSWIQLQQHHLEKIDIMITDCFSEECINDIKNLIQTHGRTLLLCDGGHKNQEFNLYSKYLKPNDVIMLHDYSHSEEDHTEYNTIIAKYGWHYGPESFYEQIKEAVKEQNLEPFMYEEFKNVIWGSFIKK